MAEKRYGCSFGCDVNLLTSQEETQHQRRCPHIQIRCPQCEQSVVRKDLAKHLTEACEYRTEECPYCCKDFLVKEMSPHQEFCPQKPIDCEYCNEKLMLKERSNHLEVCAQMPRPCLMNDLGCDFRAPLEILGQHMNDLQLHYMLMCNLVRDMRTENHELREDIRQIKKISQQTEDNAMVKAVLEGFRLETAKLNEEMKHLFNQVEVLTESNLKKDERINHLGTKIDGLKAMLNMKKEKLFTSGVKEQRKFNDDLELKINPSMQRMCNRMAEQIDLKLDLTEDCEVWVEDKTLDEIKKILSKQLFPHKDEKRILITVIYPEKDLNEAWDDVRELGDYTINGAVYRCTMVQRETQTGGGRRLELGLHQVSVQQRWPPPHVSRALLCVLDLLDSRVLFYTVKRGSLGDSKPYPGMKAMAFGSFYLSREQLAQFVGLSTSNHVSCAFILFSIPA